MVSCQKGVIIGLGADLQLNKVFNDFYVLDFGVMELYSIYDTLNIGGD